MLLLLLLLLLPATATAAARESPCASLEGLAVLAGGCGKAPHHPPSMTKLGTRAGLEVSAPTLCGFFYQQAAVSTAFQQGKEPAIRRCAHNHTAKKCEASGPVLPCSMGAVLNRSRAVLFELRGQLAGLRRAGTDPTAEEISMVGAELFQQFVQQDLKTPLTTTSEMLQTALGRASGYGWIAPAHTIEDVARQIPLDEAIGTEQVLLSAVDGARAARSKPVGWRRRVPDPAVHSLRVSDGYFTDAAGAPLTLIGYNALDHHLGIEPESMEQLRSGKKHLPALWQHRLRVLGVNAISYQPSAAITHDAQLPPCVRCSVQRSSRCVARVLAAAGTSCRSRSSSTPT